MLVDSFTHGNGHFSFLPNFSTTEYHRKTFIVNAIYNDEKFEIEEKEIYENVSKGDKIVVTIKYSYDKDDKLIYYEIHKCHPYASEEYISDIIRPVKENLHGYLDIEKELQSAVYLFLLDSEINDKEQKLIDSVDDTLLYHEFVYYMNK